MRNKPVKILCYLNRACRFSLLVLTAALALSANSQQALAMAREPASIDQSPHEIIVDASQAKPSERIRDFPEIQGLESLKSTSSVILTEEDFSAWWRQKLIASRSGNATDAIPEAAKTLTGFQPVSLDARSGLPLEASASWTEYRLKPGDIISIQLLGHAEFSQKNLLITPDALINMPLVGPISTQDSSPERLADVLKKRLSVYLRHPSVTVVLEKIAPQRAYVLGAVKKPGLYVLEGQDVNIISPVNALPTAKGDYHLSVALLKAGGLLADADLSHIKVFNLKNQQCREANITELLAYGALGEDVLMGSEDVVYVPRLANAQWNHPEILKLLASSNLGQETYPVRVYGFVNRPDVYQLSPNEMTLQTVLAKAGIDIDRAQRKQVIIARTMPNRQMLALKVDGTIKDSILYPNDVVIVAKSNWKHLVKSVFGTASSVTMPLANLKYILDTGNVVTP